MKNPLTQIQNLSRAKAVLLAGLILALFFSVSFILNIPTLGKNRLETMLLDAGFKSPRIGDIQIGFSGLKARTIALDSYGFDKIDKMDMLFSWPTFLLTGKIDEVKITNLSLSRRAGQLPLSLQIPLQNLTEMSEHRIVIENATFDVSSVVGDLRFSLNATIDPPREKNGAQTIIASLVANQYQLGFEMKWTGTLNNEKALNLDAELLDGRMHFGPLQITRFNGWMGIEATSHSFTAQSQINAGGAELFKVPMQDLSLVSDFSGNASTILFRSSMAGLENVILSADWSASDDNKNFDITLKGDNMDQFFQRLSSARNDGADMPAALKNKSPFRVQATYQADRRFAAGPLPFSLDATRGSEKILFGNFLIYPNEMDIRGSAEMDPALSKAIANFFSINAKDIDRNFIRLDGNLGALLGVKQHAPDLRSID